MLLGRNGVKCVAVSYYGVCVVIRTCTSWCSCLDWLRKYFSGAHVVLTQTLPHELHRRGAKRRLRTYSARFDAGALWRRLREVETSW